MNTQSPWICTILTTATNTQSPWICNILTKATNIQSPWTCNILINATNTQSPWICNILTKATNTQSPWMCTILTYVTNIISPWICLHKTFENQRRYITAEYPRPPLGNIRDQSIQSGILCIAAIDVTRGEQFLGRAHAWSEVCPQDSLPWVHFVQAHVQNIRIFGESFGWALQ